MPYSSRGLNLQMFADFHSCLQSGAQCAIFADFRDVYCRRFNFDFITLYYMKSQKVVKFDERIRQFIILGDEVLFVSILAVYPSHLHLWYMEQILVRW